MSYELDSSEDYKLMKKPILLWLCVLFIMLLLTGCSKFKPTVRADVGVFADNTLAMLESAEFGFTKNLPLYTKEYFSAEGPEEIQFVKQRDDAERVLRGMMSYSLRLVVITDTYKSPEKRVMAYAAYLKYLDDEILEALDLELDYYNDLIEEIDEQEKFMDALNKAQPVIDALGRYMHQSLDDLETAAEALAEKIDKRIDERYADLIRYQKTLEIEKYAILSALEQLYLTGKGDMEAYNKLKRGETVVPIKMVPENLPTLDQQIKIAKHLTAKLNFMNNIGKEIEADWNLYRETHKELDRIYETLLKEIRKFRLISLVWLRAHQKMSSGTVSPAEWFNINEAPSVLLKLGTKGLL